MPELAINVGPAAIMTTGLALFWVAQFLGWGIKTMFHAGTGEDSGN